MCMSVAALMERCSDGVEDHGAEGAFMGPERESLRRFWKPAPVRAALLSAQMRILEPHRRGELSLR